MKRLLVACIAAIAICGSPAIAADPTPMFNWSGFYVGIEGGRGWADTRHTSVLSGVNSGTDRISGGLLGGTYGYNWQNSSWVLGLEGDFSGSGIKGRFGPGVFCGTGAPCETELRWLGTNRVRLGYSWNRLLVYGTAGVAYGDVRGTLVSPAFTVGDTTRAGFVFGGGVEWAFAPAWSVKVEYLWTDLGSKVTYGSTAGGSPERVSLKNLDIVRAGLNYRFGI